MRSCTVVRTPLTRTSWLLVALTVACEAAPTGPEIAAPEFDVVLENANAAGLEVMSRNVFLGGDIGPLFSVDFDDIVAVTQAAATVWATVQSNDFPVRAGAIADEIAAAEPHIVGLQEVVRFVTLDATFTPTGGLDYLEILLAELQARGLDYEVYVQENTEVTLPTALGPAGPAELLNFTDRTGLLVRGDVTLSDVASGNYAAQFPLAEGLTLKRGWIRADAVIEGRSYRVINTHLESQILEPVQLGQTAELLGPVTGAFDGITVVMGDLNSDAEADEGAQSWTPTYGEIVGAGFTDLWDVARPGNSPVAFTCCHAPDLSSTSESLDERIDFVLLRGAPLAKSGRPLGVMKVDVVGDDLGDRSGGLWPSDHAGLVARIAPPVGRPLP